MKLHPASAPSAPASQESELNSPAGSAAFGALLPLIPRQELAFSLGLGLRERTFGPGFLGSALLRCDV